MKYILTTILLISAICCFGQSKQSFADVQKMNKAKDSLALKAKKDSIVNATEYINNNDLDQGFQFLQDNMTVTEYIKIKPVLDAYLRKVIEAAKNRKKK